MTYLHVSVCDTKTSMLLSLLLANIRILSCFLFLFLFILSNFLIIAVVRKKIRVKLALAIPSGVSTVLVREMIDTLPLAALKTIKTLSM